MRADFSESPIEELGLEEEIVKKLKKIFIYTIGQLQAKTEEALKGSWTFCEDTMSVMIISNALVKKTGIGFAKEIEEQDKIEKIKKGIKHFRLLKRSGVCRISELIRLSKFELKTITGIEEKSCEKIEERLREYYGEQYDTIKEQKIGTNPDSISLGHFDISNNLFLCFRNGEIYTVGDYQQKADTELLRIQGLDGWYIEIVNQQLLARGIKRYKEGKEAVEILDLPSKMKAVHQKNGILRVEELLEMTWQQVIEMHEFDKESVIRILEAYIKNMLIKNGTYNAITEVQVLRRMSIILSIIRKNQELEMKKLRDIVELLSDKDK